MRYPIRLSENMRDASIYIADADNKIVAHVLDPKDSEFATDIITILNAWVRQSRSIMKAA